jgi:hypothetical protein
MIKDLVGMFFVFLLAPLLFLSDYITGKTTGKPVYHGPGGVVLLAMLVVWGVLLIIAAIIVVTIWATHHFIYVP